MNRSKNNLDSAQRIQRVIEYVRDNIHSIITAPEAAKIACYSEYHFQRVFKEVLGETFGEYVTRKKLETAAIKIAYGSATNLTDIAFRYGYSSLSNFSKAFDRFFGVRPSEMQQYLITPPSKPGKLQTKHLKKMNPSEIFTSNPKPSIEELNSRFKYVDERVTIVTIQPFEVFFLTSDCGYQLDAITDLWIYIQRLLEDRNISLDAVDRFAICHDHPGLFPAHRCRYDACIKAIPELADLPLLKTKIPGGRFAICSCEGPQESVLPQYIEFATVWLPRSGYEPSDFPTVDHLLTPDKSPFIQELWRKINIL